MTLATRLAEHALHRPDDVAITFLADGEADEAKLTFGALDAAARSYGAALQHLGLSGERAVLAFPTGLEFIGALFGCFYAGVIAAPAPALRLRDAHDLARIEGMVRNCGAAVLITSDPLIELKARCPVGSPLASIPWVSRADVEAIAGGRQAAVTPHAIAFLQYTSGSTSEPKGVVVSHDNLIANFRAIAQGMQITPETAFLSWLPLHHDMGLIGILLQALYSTNPLVLMTPLHFVQRPIRWLKAISKYRTNLSGGPNFAFDLCVQKITPEDAADLRLDAWEVAFNGAEPVRAESIDAFCRTFGPYGFDAKAFYPCYGMAETTLYIAGAGRRPIATRSFDAGRLTEGELAAAAGDAKAARLVSCGRPPADHDIVVVDPVTQRLQPEGKIGELIVSGPSVCDGYWPLSSASAPFKSRTADGGRDYFRTGDLGAVVDGELFVTGRLKDLIIVRGRNIYPQDLELTSERACAAIEPGNAAAFTDDEGRLVIVQELRRPTAVDIRPVVQAIVGAVSAAHDVRPYRVAIVQRGTLLKTSSGKLRRAATRAALAAGDFQLFQDLVDASDVEPEKVS